MHDDEAAAVSCQEAFSGFLKRWATFPVITKLYSVKDILRSF